MGAAANHTGGEAGPADTVYLGVYRREAIEQVGGYDETMLIAEDWELNYRIRAAGGLIWFTPDLKVTYRPRATLGALAKQQFRYGRWRRVVARRYPETVNPRYLAAAGRDRAQRRRPGRRRGRAHRGAGGGARTRSVPDSRVRHPGHLPRRGHRGRGAVRRGRSPPACGRACPLVLAAMHTCWGAGFLTSPRRLAAAGGRASSRPCRLVLIHQVMGPDMPVGLRADEPRTRR